MAVTYFIKWPPDAKMAASAIDSYTYKKKIAGSLCAIFIFRNSSRGMPD
jgi:hypothetical protein